jgi:hypothetical protein
VPAAHAQGQGGKVPVAVELRLLVFHSSDARDEVFAHDPAAPEEVAAVKTPLRSYLNHQFATVMLTGRKVVFTKEPDRAALTRPESLLAELDLPADLRSAILLFLPEKAGAKQPFRVLVIDDSKRAFPAGSFRVSNLSPQPVRIVLESKTYEFKPGATQFIEDPPVRDGNQSGMKAFAFHNGNWQRIASGIWPHPGRGRAVQVLFVHPATGMVQLRAFDDVPPRDPAPQPQG